MTISGFTIAKNTSKLFYPVVESIRSILPLVDEFVIAMGDNDEDDNTLELLNSINSPKIKIIDSPWDTKTFGSDTEMARQTDIAKSHCTGDWLFYLQTDEVVHENDLPVIKSACEENLNNLEVDGLLFNYLHFWGDYSHRRVEHGWYKNEIRVVRNKPDIHSWRDAQSFRIIPNFNGIDYNSKEGTQKLKVKAIDAFIYHYGWALPPDKCLFKRHVRDANRKGEKVSSIEFSQEECKKVYGSLKKVASFNGSHPKIMSERIEAFDWENQLDYVDEFPVQEKFKKRFVTFLEQKVVHRPLFEFKNYILVD